MSEDMANRLCPHGSAFPKSCNICSATAALTAELTERRTAEAAMVAEISSVLRDLPHESQQPLPEAVRRLIVRLEETREAWSSVMTPLRQIDGLRIGENIGEESARMIRELRGELAERRVEVATLVTERDKLRDSLDAVKDQLISLREAEER
jgi:hypothetical protein